MRVIELLRRNELFPLYNGLISQRERDGLVLLKYTPHCQYGQRWDDVTITCRGLIIDTRDFTVAARPFTKFFNLNERPETDIANLPQLPFRIFEKLDGSLGTLYRDHDGVKRLATPGSFDSPQALRGTKMLQELRHLERIPNELTLCFEIIYRGQHMKNEGDEGFSVVNYDFEGLVLLAAFNRFTGDELVWAEVETLASALGCRLPKTYAFASIDEMIANAQELPPSMEGYVIRWENGLRAKCKGHGYLDLHRTLWGVSNSAVHERLLNGTYEQFLREIPEEHRPYVEARAAPIIDRARVCEELAYEYFVRAPTKNRKEFALWVNENVPSDVRSAVFHMYGGDPNWYEYIEP